MQTMLTKALGQTNLAQFELVRSEVFPIEVDYALSVEEMIAMGNYRDPVFWELRHVRICGNGRVAFEACHFYLINGSMYPEHAALRIKAADECNPWDVARLEHLLAFGTRYPEQQMECPIIAPGTVVGVGGGTRMPQLTRDGSERSLYACWAQLAQQAIHSFLAVRPVKA